MEIKFGSKGTYWNHLEITLDTSNDIITLTKYSETNPNIILETIEYKKID